MTSRTPSAVCLALCLAVLITGCESVPVTPPAPPAAVEVPPAQPAPEPPADVVIAPPPEPPAEPVEIEEPAPPPPPVPVACEPPPAPPKPAEPQRPQTVLPIFGILENVLLDPPGIILKARLDTGITTSSLRASDIREFERDGKLWVKFQLEQGASDQTVEVSRPVVRTITLKTPANARRYIVTLKASIGSVEHFTDFILSDRPASSYPVLIGRDFLRDQALVDVGRRYTAQTPKQ
jgi:hypothetical protein